MAASSIGTCRCGLICRREAVREMAVIYFLCVLASLGQCELQSLHFPSACSFLILSLLIFFSFSIDIFPGAGLFLWEDDERKIKVFGEKCWWDDNHKLILCSKAKSHLNMNDDCIQTLTKKALSNVTTNLEKGMLSQFFAARRWHYSHVIITMRILLFLWHSPILLYVVRWKPRPASKNPLSG